MRKNKYLYITLLSLLGFYPETQAQSTMQIPRLVVSITVDDLDSDLLEQMVATGQHPTLQRVVGNGTVYHYCHSGFTPTNKYALIASLYTGTVPYYHGITDSEWLDRNTLRPKSIIEDKNYHVSPQQIAVSTLTDELKKATQGTAKIFSFASQAESAILSAGHAADAAGWIEDDEWQISSYYTTDIPWLDSDLHDLQQPDDGNIQVVGTALECLREEALGQDESTDMLCLTLSAGTPSFDSSLAQLMDHIASSVLPERTLFVLVGNGQRKEEEGINSQYRIPTGQFFINRSANLLNVYLGAVYGTGRYVDAVYGNQLFLNKSLISKKAVNMTDLLSLSQDFLLQLSGVKNVYTAHQLLTSSDQHTASQRKGFNAEKCGDLLLEIAPGWTVINENTHTSTISNIGNLSFPVIFYGTQIKAQRVVTPITVDRIAPTIARAIRIRAPNACLAEPLF